EEIGTQFGVLRVGAHFGLQALELAGQVVRQRRQSSTINQDFPTKPESRSEPMPHTRPSQGGRSPPRPKGTSNALLHLLVLLDVPAEGRGCALAALVGLHRVFGLGLGRLERVADHYFGA